MVRSGFLWRALRRVTSPALGEARQLRKEQVFGLLIGSHLGKGGRAAGLDFDRPLIKKAGHGELQKRLRWLVTCKFRWSIIGPGESLTLRPLLEKLASCERNRSSAF
jgi:hypothetical protein